MILLLFILMSSLSTGQKIVVKQEPVRYNPKAVTELDLHEIVRYRSKQYETLNCV